MSQDQDEHPADVREFVGTINAGSPVALPGFFDPGGDILIARAPGRLDVMGGIADYSGGLVLQLPLAEATLVAVQATDDDRVCLASLAEGGSGAPRQMTLTLEQVAGLAQGSYDQARAWFGRDPQQQWAGYVAGVLIVIARHYSLTFERGLRILVQSHVPEGKGVSSSAALEVATMHALAHLFGISLNGVQLAHLCQEAENRVVGAPCGIMDQMTAAVGHRDQLLALLCQPADVQGFLPVPAGLRFWGIDSGIRHAVSGSDYGSVRTGTFMGYRILADLAGLEVTPPDATGVVRVVDPLWRGYLVNMSSDDFTERFADRLPREMTGAEFLARYGGTTDPVTRVDPQRTYPIYQPTLHPIQEHQRVRRFASLLLGSLGPTDCQELGRLMYAAHESYSACGLGSTGTDMLVEMVRGVGPAGGLYGAKITGGGSGGAVAVLGAADAEPVVRDLAARYGGYAQRQVAVFAGSSSGAIDFGTLRLDEF